ncbi:SDR family oxidoreductase [Methylolobus aquaticus]|nr:SDR family oxidoreductase [Methylolobus aquaticus]
MAGKHAVITGAAAGLGFAMAQLFGRQGARVVLIDCAGDKLAQASDALRAEGIDADAYHADVAHAEAVEQAFAAIRGRFGGVIHVLVNNAGIAEFAGVEETEPELWHRTLAVNVTGTYLCARAALPAMRREGGSVVNIASIAGVIGIPRMAAYCASKGAVIALTRQMAVDYTGLGIRVNCLCPGRVAGTDLDRAIMAGDSDEDTLAKIAKYPIGRFGRPDEIAQAALFLASDEASFVSGTAFCVDGAMTAL